jgi:RecA/RadA recombinase
MDKNILKALETLDEGNPYSSFLSNSTISTVSEWIDTGNYILNAIISGKVKSGGIPDGRLTMFQGESMTQKTSIILRILSNAQKAGRVPVIFDTENAVDQESAIRAGLTYQRLNMYLPLTLSSAEIIYTNF